MRVNVDRYSCITQWRIEAIHSRPIGLHWA